MNNRDLIFIDTETTGLDPAKHEIIEIAWMVTSPDTKVTRSSYKARMLPTHVETAEPRALEINGYTEAAWRAGPLKDPQKVAEEIIVATSGKILVGHNVSFDEGFLKALCSRFSLEPSWSYHKVDTVALAWPLYATSDLPGLSLEKLCTYLQIPQEKKHAADADIMRCYLAYQAMMHRYAPNT